MSREKCQKFITEAKEYFLPAIEPTFFDVGLRGHYENPTTELLAFFLNPNNVHGLSDYFLCGLFKALEVDYQKAGGFIRISREVKTGGGRIDLLIEMENTVLVIECKIYHHVNNPFASYENYAKETFKNKPNKKFALLSVTGESLNKSDDNSYYWKGISYENLASSINKFKVDNINLSKWQVLANELLLQFENYGVAKMNEEQFKFTLENLENINQLKRLENAFYDEVTQRIKNMLNATKSSKLIVRHQVWNETTKVLRFSLDTWQSEHDCALCFEMNNEKPFTVKTWVMEDYEQALQVQLNQLSKFEFGIQVSARETYLKKEWPRWDWPLNNIDSAIELIAKLLQALDEIEVAKNNK